MRSLAPGHNFTRWRHFLGSLRVNRCTDDVVGFARGSGLEALGSDEGEVMQAARPVGTCRATRRPGETCGTTIAT
jgi:hypothetical protein